MVRNECQKGEQKASWKVRVQLGSRISTLHVHRPGFASPNHKGKSKQARKEVSKYTTVEILSSCKQGSKVKAWAIVME